MKIVLAISIVSFLTSDANNYANETDVRKVLSNMADDTRINYKKSDPTFFLHEASKFQPIGDSINEEGDSRVRRIKRYKRDFHTATESPRTTIPSSISQNSSSLPNSNGMKIATPYERCNIIRKRSIRRSSTDGKKKTVGPRERFERILSYLQARSSTDSSSVTPIPAVFRTDFSTTDDFYELRASVDFAVDKSLLIKEFTEDAAKVILVERPKKWGKTINLDMLRRFFLMQVFPNNGSIVPLKRSVNRKLFTGGRIPVIRGPAENKTFEQIKPLRISEDNEMMKHQGRYPVIYANFAGVDGTSYDVIKRQIITELGKLYSQYPYLRQCTDINDDLLTTDQKRQLNKYYTGECNGTDVQDSLRFLSEMLYTYFGAKRKVYVFLDQIDTIVNRCYVTLKERLERDKKRVEDSAELHRLVELFRAILRNAFNGNQYLKKAFISGTLHLAKADFYSDTVDLVKHNVFGDKYGKHYGFTQEEVDGLLAKVPYITDLKQIANWYKGYRFNGESIYNPWSIMQYIANGGIFDCYWLNASGAAMVEEQVVSDAFQQDVYKIVAGDVIKAYPQRNRPANLDDLNGNRQNLLNLLLFTGHLTFARQRTKQHRSSGSGSELACPNEEVRFLYEHALEDWIDFETMVNGSKWFAGKRNLLVDSLVSEEVEDFRILLDRIVVENFRCDHTSGSHPERLYQLVMTCLFRSMYFHRITAGNDVVILEPNQRYYDTAAVIKIKVINTTTNKANSFNQCLEEVDDRKYTAGRVENNPHVARIIKVCLLMDGVEITYKYRVTKIKQFEY